MTIPGAVVDASVVIPWFHAADEPYRSQCSQLAEDFKRKILRLVVPELFLYEMSNFVATRKDVRPEMWEDLRWIIDMDFEVHRFEKTEILEVTATAIQQGLTAYDASYFLTAELLDLPLYSADERLVKAWGKRPGGHIKHYGRRVN